MVGPACTRLVSAEQRAGGHRKRRVPDKQARLLCHCFLLEGLPGCQAGGGFVTDTMMVKTPNQELDKGILGSICNRLKASLECLFINGCQVH